MIYKAMLENDIKDIVQDPENPGVDLDAVEKAIAGDNGIGAHQDEVDDAVEGMIGDPVEEFAMIMYESEYNYNQIMEAIGMAELREAAMGRDLVLEAADIGAFFKKIKEFFVRMFERFTEAVRNIMAKLNLQVKSDKKYVEENRALIEKGYATDCWKDDEGYDVFSLNLIAEATKLSVSAEDVDDINKAKAKLATMINSEDIDATLENLKELNKKNLTKTILQTKHKDSACEDLGAFRKYIHDDIFNGKKKLKTLIENASYVPETLKNDEEGKAIRDMYKAAKDEYKKIFDNISKWEKAAKSNNIEGKDKYLAACQILTKAFKIDRSINDIVFAVITSAYNYKRSICRKLAHKFVSEAKKTANPNTSTAATNESTSIFGRISLA